MYSRSTTFPLALLFALASCGGDVTSPTNTDPTIGEEIDPNAHFVRYRGSGIVRSVVTPPIVPDGRVAGRTTDIVINLDVNMAPTEPGLPLEAGRTIKITLPDEFVDTGSPPLGDIGSGPTCVPSNLQCTTAVLLQGWPQNPIRPPVAKYALSMEGTHTLVYTALEDLLPMPTADPATSEPGIKQLHVLGLSWLNAKPGIYPIKVEAETGPGGAMHKGVGHVRIMPKTRPHIGVTSVFNPTATRRPNTIYQSAPTNSSLPLEWNFLVWDRLGEPAIGVTVHQVNPRHAQLKQGSKVVGTITIQAPRGASGQEVSGGPSVLINGPVKNLPTGRLTVQFTTGDTPGVYATTLRMNNGTSVTMYATAAHD